jgi:hypothetical protein
VAMGVSEIICKRCDRSIPLADINPYSRACYECKPRTPPTPEIPDERTPSVSVRAISTATETQRRRH